MSKNLFPGMSRSIITCGGRDNTVAAGATAYLSPGCNASTDASARVPLPDCTIDEYRVNVNTAPVGAETFTYDLMRNGGAVAGSTIVLTGANVSGVKSGLAVVCSAGDTLSVRVVVSAGGAVAVHKTMVCGYVR